MLTVAMNQLLSPFYDPKRVRFVTLAVPPVLGFVDLPERVPLPVDADAEPSPADASYSMQDLVAGAAYVLCYQPLHHDVALFRNLARGYIQTFAPDFLSRLVTGACEARGEGDWVGTIGRLWTVLQIDPLSPDVLSDLAFSALQFGFAASRRSERGLAARLARVSGAALNTLHEYFPDYGPGHFRRAEFLLAAGDTGGAKLALKTALRLGLPPETALEAREILGELQN